MIQKPTPKLRERKPCEICGQPIHRKARRFCSLKCHGASMVKAQPLCPVCKERPISWRGAKFCSQACGYKSRRDKQKPVACRGCGELFRPYPSALQRGRGFCSRECFYRTEGRARYDSATCTQCGIPFQRRPSNMRQPKFNKFCSPACSKLFHRGEQSPVYRGGSYPNRGRGWLKRAEQARERDGRLCRRCGKTEEENGQRLSVDHLIPWRQFRSAEEANQLENLVSLCRPCHSTKTFYAEARWLRGDVQAMEQHRLAVTLPSAVHEQQL